MKAEKLLELKACLESTGRVTRKIKETYFQGTSFKEIRDTIEQLGLDRHMPIELFSTEIAIVTPLGILMQIRPSDNDQLGLWGGVLHDGEEPVSGALRELYEETGLVFGRSQLEYIETNTHEHEYANGDKAVFTSYRYAVRLDKVPKITTDEESVGVFMVVHTIISHQHEFIKRLLGEK